jgi:hypothetical protein
MRRRKRSFRNTWIAIRARLADGVVPAFYSGSPELARTVNLVRLTAAGGAVVTREALLQHD